MIFESEGAVEQLQPDIGSSPVAVRLQGRLLEASERLRALAINRAQLAVFRVAIRKENWDGHGSARVNENSATHAIAMADAFIQQVANANLQWLDPHVGSTETGDIVFEWWNGLKKLTLYIAPEVIEYVSSWGPNIETQMDAGVLGEGKFAELWYWLRLPTA